MKIDKYLYEIIEDYKSASSEEERLEIFKGFCSSIWGSKNKRRVYSKTIKFKVRSDLLTTEIGQVFNTWSEIDYISHKTLSKDTDWCSLIRQKINNIYTRYFDKDVILKKDYMDLLKTPKKLYYRWINGQEINVDELISIIEDSIYKASELKSMYQKQKMELSWDEYKKVVEEFLKGKFDKCKLIEDYEKEHSINNVITVIYDFYNEDNSYIRYICNSLELFMLDYQKEYYGLKRSRDEKYKRCKECGNLIKDSGNKKMYCDNCAKKRKRESNRISDKKYKNKRRENRNVIIQH